MSQREVTNQYHPLTVSFGARAETSYAGKTTGDLQCTRKDASGRDRAKLRILSEFTHNVESRQVNPSVGITDAHDN